MATNRFLQHLFMRKIGTFSPGGDFADRPKRRLAVARLTTTGLALAALLGAYMVVGQAAAMPADGLKAAASQVGNVQDVRWVCGPYRCWWAPGPYWGYGPGPYWRGGWGWRRGWGWRHHHRW